LRPLPAQTDEPNPPVHVARRRVEPGELCNGHPNRQERVDSGRLEDDTDAPPKREGSAGGILAEHRDLAPGPGPVAFEDLDRRGLAGTVRAEEGEDLSAPD